MGLIMPVNVVKFRNLDLNSSGEIRPKAVESAFLGKTPIGVLPLCDDRRTPASSSSSSLAQSEAVVYLENGLT